MRRTIVLALTALLTATALAGCADNGGTTTTPGGTTPTTGATPATTPPPTTGASQLTIGTTDTITSLDPANAYEYLSINILQNTMGNLVVNEPDSADLVPEMATGMPTVSADGLTYTFTLRPGLKYSDGTPIRAADFLWSMERNSGPVGGAEGGPAFLIYDSPGVDIANSSAPSDTQLVIKLRNPGVFFNALLVFPNFAPLPQSMYTKAAFREPTGTTANLPISSGPYKITEYRQGEFVKLEKNANYQGPRAAATDTIILRLYSNSAALKNALQNGEIDIAYRTFTPDEWTDLGGRSGITTDEQVGPSPARYLSFNVNKTGSGVDKQGVRQAIAYLVDRDEINDAVFSGTVTPLYSIVAPGLPGQKQSYRDMYGASPNAARAGALMEAAGYSTTNKLSIDLWFNSDGHYGDTEEDLATVLKDQLESSGYFTVRLQSKPWAEYKVDFRAGNYAMFLLGWYPDYLDTDNYVSPFLTPGGARAFGTFYNNATLQPLIKAQQAETDPAERNRILGQIQDIAATDNPMLPIFSGQQQVAYRNGVTGATLSPTAVFPYYTLAK